MHWLGELYFDTNLKDNVAPVIIRSSCNSFPLLYAQWIPQQVLKGTYSVKIGEHSPGSFQTDVVHKYSIAGLRAYDHSIVQPLLV